MLSRKNLRSGDDFSRLVKELRLQLSLTQHAFAELLQVRPQVVASWEQGRREPSARSYQQLARLAPPEQARFFLQRMGLTEDLIRKLIPEGSAADPAIRPYDTQDWKKGAEERLPFQVQIPVLKREAAAKSPQQIGWRDIDCLFTVPEGAVPRGPGAYTGIYVEGSAMEPILEDRFIAVIDHTRQDAMQLRGRLVAVLLPDGAQVKLLARDSRADHLILRSYNPEYADIVVESPGPSTIIGDVVYWWGAQPAPPSSQPS